MNAESLLKEVGIARSTYYYQLKAMRRPDKNANLLSLVREAFGNSRRRYGYKRIHLELKSAGIIVSAKRIMRLMTSHGMVPVLKSAKRYSSYKGEIGGAPANLVNRDFHATAPNRLWGTDITEFSIPAGKVYLSPVIDCHDGMPVAWTIGTSPQRRPGQRHASRRVRHAQARRDADHPLGQGLPLPVAGMDPHLHRARADPVDVERMIATTGDCDRIRLAVAPHSPYTCSPESLQRGKELARRHGLWFMTHISETEDEVRIVRERYGTTSVRHLDTLGILDDRTIGAHCVHVDDGDIRILREREVAVSHNPQSNMKISSGIAPIARMHSEGVLCTIGTDGTCSNNDLDMWDEMRTASFLQKVATMDPCVLPAYEILKMATVNAARAIGHAGELGVIKEGALADFILIDAVKPHLMPVYNMVANLIYCGKAADVDTVVVNGEIVVEGRRIEGVDLSNLCFQVQHTAEDIARRTAAAKK